MLILSADQSTSLSSVALLKDGEVVYARSWRNERLRNQKLFPALTELLRTTSTEIAAINLFAVGLGPGSFMGIRMSISAMRGLALPNRKPVTGFSCGETLAHAVLTKHPGRIVTVVGDARRKKLWLVQIQEQGTNANLSILTQYRLIGYNELAGYLSNETILISPDWDRIGGTLQQQSGQGVEILEGEQNPDATSVGQLACHAAAAHHQLNRPEPIYLHPPVFVKPRFS